MTASPAASEIQTPEEIAAEIAVCTCSERTSRLVETGYHYGDCYTHLRDDIAAALRAERERGAAEMRERAAETLSPVVDRFKSAVPTLPIGPAADIAGQLAVLLDACIAAVNALPLSETQP